MSQMRRSMWLMGAVVGALVGMGPAHAASTRTVDIKEFRYAPTTLTVPVGSTVTWINHDEEPHTVTSTTGRFSSAGLEHEEHFVQRFDTPGIYAYTCALHPHMKATVIVK